jgi:NifU-like protein involved in Fe-S cluster formation
VNAPIYTTEILRLAAALGEPRALARLDGSAELRSPTCGSTIATIVMLDDAGCVIALSQTARACAFGQATAALLEQSAVGKAAGDVEQALEQLSGWLGGRRDDPGDWPGLAALAPARRKIGRHGAILLPFRALLAAMQAE